MVGHEQWEETSLITHFKNTTTSHFIFSSVVTTTTTNTATMFPVLAAALALPVVVASCIYSNVTVRPVEHQQQQQQQHQHDLQGLPGSTYLISLLDEQESYTEAQVKAMLRARCPQFSSLNAKAASRKARDVLRLLSRDYGKGWDKKPSETIEEQPPNVPTDYSLDTRRLRSNLPVQRLLRLDPQLTWLIDVEFMTLTRSKAPLPFAISIINLDGDEILTCNVDYELSIEELEEAVEPYLAYSDDALRVRRAMFRTMFMKHYGGRRTNGKTQLEIKTALAAYTDNHTLLGYGTNLDLSVFHRFRGCLNNSPLAAAVSYEQAIDVRKVVKYMLPWYTRCYSRFSSSLDEIHLKLIPGSTHTGYHWAHVDVRAFRELILLVIETAERI
jgi:hypothetical protein